MSAVGWVGWGGGSEKCAILLGGVNRNDNYNETTIHYTFLHRDLQFFCLDYCVLCPY